jgi:hypothetical protein
VATSLEMPLISAYCGDGDDDDDDLGLSDAGMECIQ